MRQLVRRSPLDVKGHFLWLLSCLALYIALVAITPLTEWQWESLVPPSRSHDKADGAIVLGYTLTRNGSVDTVLADRLQTGLELLRAGGVGKIMVSGGRQNITKQADVMAAWLRERGASDSDILKEDGSHNTWQNAAMSLTIVRQLKWKRILVVTSSFHLERSLAVFQWTLHKMQKEHPTWHVDIDVAQPLQGEYRPRWWGQVDYVREVGALLWYLIRGRSHPMNTIRALSYKVVGPALLIAAVLYLPYYLLRIAASSSKQKKKEE